MYSQEHDEEFSLDGCASNLCLLTPKQFTVNGFERADSSSNWRIRGPGSALPTQDAGQRGVPSIQRDLRERTRGSFRRPAPAPKPSRIEESPRNRIYVGNLLYQVHKDEVQELFTSNGFDVAGVEMSVDPFSGRSPGYCFVDLDDVETATRAIEQLQGLTIRERPIKINTKTARRANNAHVPDRPLVTKGKGIGWSEHRLSGDGSPRIFDRYSDKAAEYWQRPLDEKRRLYIGGLPRMEPQNAVQQAIENLFISIGMTNGELQAVSKIVSPNQEYAKLSTRDHYYLFVDLVDSETADVAIQELNDSQSPWGKGRLRVSRARDNPNRKACREQGISETAQQQSVGRTTDDDEDEDSGL